MNTVFIAYTADLAWMLSAHVVSCLMYKLSDCIIKPRFILIDIPILRVLVFFILEKLSNLWPWLKNFGIQRHTLVIKLPIPEKRFSNADLTKVSGKQVSSCSLITSCNPSPSIYITTNTSQRPKALPHGAFCLLLTYYFKVKGIVIVCCCYDDMTKHRVNLPLPTFAPCAIVCIIRLSCKKRELGGVDVRTADTVLTGCHGDGGRRWRCCGAGPVSVDSSGAAQSHAAVHPLP